MSETSKIEELLGLRSALGFTQDRMAREIDLSLREYQAFEWGETEIPDLYLRALERIAIRYAVHLEDPRLVPQPLREEVLKLARIMVAST
ncbi:MAG TPA: transcriptional regulator [Microvirga sp.]|nr:transcriptional regulator [Microvirga sp.]